MSDISTLKSVLSCPIFDRIINVTDSLDELAYQINLHPSITPEDISIDSNGKLTLPPPIEAKHPNDLINNRLNDYNPTNSNNGIKYNNNTFNEQQRLSSPPHHENQQTQIHLGNNQIKNNKSNNITIPNANQFNQKCHITQQQQQPTISADSEFTSSESSIKRGNQIRNNGLAPNESPLNNHHYGNQNKFDSPKARPKQLPSPTTQPAITDPNYVPSAATIISTFNSFNTEKLVSNGNLKTQTNGKHTTATKPRVQTPIKPQISSKPQQLYKTGEHYRVEQNVHSNDGKQRIEINGSRNNANLNGKENYSNNDNSSRNGYSNELYKTTQEIEQQTNSIAIDNQKPQSQQPAQTVDSRGISKSVVSQNLQDVVQFNRGSCSPSTSAGSTVKLADECDSGASSYQSHTTKGVQPYTVYNYKTNDSKSDSNCAQLTQTSPIGDGPDSLEQKSSSDIVSPDMERIKVTLEKDSNGLGITIAGYTFEEEEISGIFIKNVTPGSAADKCGKIRNLDQIYSVNGKELLNFNNKEAVRELRRTGKVVTLELLRYLADSKYRKLEKALALAKPNYMTNSLIKKLTNQNNETSPTISTTPTRTGISNSTISPTRSSIPVYRTSDSRDQSPTKPSLVAQDGPALRSTYVHVSNGSQKNGSSSAIESIYKNDSIFEENKDSSKTEPLIRNSSSLPQEVSDENKTSAVSVSGNNVLSHIPVAAQRGGTNKVIETKQGARNTIDIRPPICQTTATATYVNKFGDVDYCDSARRSVTARLRCEASDDFNRLVKSEEPEWEKEATIVELYKDPSQGLGFTVKDYVNPKDTDQLIIMITSITPGGIAAKDGHLEFGDLLIFVDDENLEGSSLNDAVKALKRASGRVRLGVLKLKRNL